MTEQELNAIYYLDKQISRLKRRIAELKGEMFGGGGMGTTRGSLPGNPTERIAIKQVELLEQLNKALEDKIDAEIAIRKFIDNIPDHQLRTIFEDRFIYLMSWQDIAADISPENKDIDRTTVSKKVRSYLKNFR